MRSRALLLFTAMLSAGSGLTPAIAQVTPQPAPVTAHPHAAFIAEASQRFGIPEHWIRAVLRVESAGDVRAISSAGAMGLMQVMPDTWAGLRSRHGLGRDPYHPRDNILAGTAYLREMWDRYGNVAAMLAAYNAGPGRYEKHLVTGDPLPAETVAYMAKIVPQIDADATVAWRTADRPARSEWSVTPLFIARAAVAGGGGDTAADLTSDGPSKAGTITDLSALAPPSFGLFVHRSDGQEARP